jgi:transcriptional regulator with XRE-family HTH domain
LANQSSPPTEDEDQILRDFGAQFRLAREYAGLSQEVVAERLGMTQPNVSEIERGQVNVTLKMMVRLASAVNGALSLHLMPSGPVTAEARIERFLEEFQFFLLGLLDQVNKLRPPAVHLAEAEPERPRRGRRPKKRTPNGD